MNVPFLDLITPHRELEEELMGVVRDTFRTGRFIGGPLVEDFEREFAAYCDTRYCVGVGSGTDALRFALEAAGVRRGDVVITVPFTFIATTEAISQVGARPAFVDIDPRTYNMDPGKLGEFLETRCRTDEKTGKLVHVETGASVTAVVPVHLYGQMADMNAISALAARHHLIVIEDACQAHGSEYRPTGDALGKVAGSAAKAGAFSFYPGKNLGACGEGGAVTTNDEEIAVRVRMLRDHGQIKKYLHTIEGYNGRLDAVQAGILGLKLKHLSAWNEKRRQIARHYNDLLGELKGIVLPHVPDWANPVYHLYVVRAANRDRLQAFLADNSIGTGLHYPIPLHLQQPYAALGYKQGDFPAAEKSASEVLSLPMFPGMSEDQQLHVIETILHFDFPVEQIEAGRHAEPAGVQPIAPSA